MKEPEKRTSRILAAASIGIGSTSEIVTLFVNQIFGPNKIVSLICTMIALICLVIVVVIIVYEGIGALQALGGKKEEKNDYDSFKASVGKVGEQYAEFQKYIEKMERTIGERMVCPAGNTIFKYSSTDVTTDTKLFLDKHPNTEIHIICYGRNGYGDVIDHIRQKKLNVNVKMMVYNPKADFSICKQGDNTRIEDCIVDILNAKISVELYASNIPPSIRACIIYKKNHGQLVPIRGTVQSYRFEKKLKGGFTIQKPDKSLIPICGEKTINEDFRGMVECFEEEFSYLQEDCCEVRLENAKLKFIPYNKIKTRKRG